MSKCPLIERRRQFYNRLMITPTRSLASGPRDSGPHYGCVKTASVYRNVMNVSGGIITVIKNHLTLRARGAGARRVCLNLAPGTHSVGGRSEDVELRRNEVKVNHRGRQMNTRHGRRTATAATPKRTRGRERTYETIACHGNNVESRVRFCFCFLRTLFANDA